MASGANRGVGVRGLSRLGACRRGAATCSGWPWVCSSCLGAQLGVLLSAGSFDSLAKALLLCTVPWKGLISGLLSGAWRDSRAEELRASRCGATKHCTWTRISPADLSEPLPSPGSLNPMALGRSCCAFPSPPCAGAVPGDAEPVLCCRSHAHPRDGAAAPALLPARLSLNCCIPTRSWRQGAGGIVTGKE